MHISKTIAMRIVTELGAIIDQRINLMDESGAIIASTDPSRIGTLHGGAQKVVRERLPELFIAADGEYPGSRAGLNLPIEMDGEIIGVVGITGEYAAIEKHGLVIKKMTEILLLDNLLKERKRLERSIQARFLQEWIFGGGEIPDGALERRGLALGINVMLPRRVILLSPADRSADTSEGQQRLEHLEQELCGALGGGKDSLVVASGSKFVCLVPSRRDDQMLHLATRLCGVAAESSHVPLAAGIDGGGGCGPAIRTAYLQAEKALRASLAREGCPPMLYRDIDLELFIHEISPALKREFLDKVFSGCTAGEVEDFCLLLKALFTCNGSIQAASSHLFIHKNTLQYKINKLIQRTGLDPRTSEGTALYYLAIAFRESLE